MLTNTTLANSKKPHQNALLSNNEKSVSHFERKRRPDVCVIENVVKTSIPVTIPGSSSYASISKNARNILFVGHSHVKRT